MWAFRAFAFATFLAATACGRVSDLEPAKGQPLPVKPMMARATPTAEQLLTPPTTARAERIDELLRKSQPRQSDPFDLPPATGGNAPPAPAGAIPQNAPDKNDYSGNPKVPSR